MAGPIISKLLTDFFNEIGPSRPIAALFFSRYWGHNGLRDALGPGRLGCD